MKSGAVIVEPRKHPALGLVVANALQVLPVDWEVLVLFGLGNSEFVKSLGSDPRLKTRQLRVSNLSPKDYSALLMTSRFWETLPYENILIFQTDSLLFENSPWKIENFMSHEYIGAPWSFCPFVGNGGLSFRKKQSMLRATRSHKYKNMPEDIFFSKHCRTAPLEEARKFSVETLFSLGTFGCHKPWETQLTKEQIDQLCQQSPRLRELIELNNKWKKDKPPAKAPTRRRRKHRRHHRHRRHRN